ncbi:MAG TPA: Si-specific NAD(P)(+) transhydrogenase [Actinomycetota bacterium]|nr:Si-specific NAD(P)(+) transhydrogenase [Actinomycetota bacterium]
MVESFDFVVIGSGPAGEKAAALAAYFDKKVAIVERQPVPGGSPVTNAGIPTKTLRETALYLTGFRRREVYGVSLELKPDVTVERLRSRTAEVIETMSRTVRSNLERHGIELVPGEGRLAPGRRVIVRTPDGAERTLQAERILIATGSRPFHPPGIPFEDPDVYDSEEIVKVDRPVRSTVVIGAGPVGCEYASIFTALGAEVCLIDGAPRLLPFLDAEMSDLLAETFEKEGMRVLLNAGRAQVRRDEQGIRVDLPSGQTLRPEQVLMAAGRAGNTEGLGLEEAGIEVDERKRIRVDAQYRTTAEGIYAAGDVIGPPALASVSMEQGRVAAYHAFDTPFENVVDPLAPFGVYSIPEVAMVGLTERAAAEQGIDYEVGRGWFSRNARANISGATEGLVKLVFRKDDRTLLGVHILGDIAAELISHGQVAVQAKMPIDHFIQWTYNVPTLSEAYKYAAYDGLQRLRGKVLR